MAQSELLPDAIRQMIDRQEILDCLTRYCCGMDRLDREMVLSAYHADAFDDHGAIRACADEFVDLVFARHRAGLSEVHQHHITGHMIDLDGDCAHSVTYFLYVARPPGPAEFVNAHGGRYIDRFEKRSGRWAIADRVCLVEWGGKLGPIATDHAGPPPITGMASRDRNDLQYVGPLVVTR